MIKFWKRKLPHEIYPEVLTWNYGDILIGEPGSVCYGTFRLESITDDGFVFLQERYNGMQKIPLSTVVKLRNKSLLERENEETLKKTDSYQKYLTDFRNAVEELKKR